VKSYQGLGHGWIPWNDLGNGKLIWDFENGICRVSSLETGVSKFAKYILDLMAIKEVRPDNGDSELADYHTFFCGQGSSNLHLRTGFFIDKGIISA